MGEMMKCGYCAYRPFFLLSNKDKLIDIHVHMIEDHRNGHDNEQLFDDILYLFDIREDVDAGRINWNEAIDLAMEVVGR